jgi:nitroreductase
MLKGGDFRMNTLEAIHTRRSIRKYTDQPISEDVVDKIIAAGMSAPSAGNQQPWQFVVIDDKKLLAKIASINQWATMAKEAPLGIIVCGDLSLEKHKGFWVQDCSACIQNMLLASHELGLGAVWTAAYPIQEKIDGLKGVAKIESKDIIPLAFIVIGYPGQKLPGVDRFKKERIHHNKW